MGTSMVKHFSISSICDTVNRWIAYAITIWVCLPWITQNTGMTLCMGLILLWIVTRLFPQIMTLKFKFSAENISLCLFSIYVFIILLLGGKAYTSFDNLYFISNLSIFIIGYYMFKYYAEKKDEKTLGKIAVISIISLLIGCFFTIYYVDQYPMIVKSISQSTDTEFMIYRKAGIGSFGFVFMAMFSILAISYTVIGRNGLHVYSRVLLLVSIFIMCSCIIKSGFSTAIILFIAGLIITLLNRDKINIYNVLIGILLLIVLFLTKEALGEFLTSLQIKNEMVNTRIKEIGEFLISNEQGENLNSRSKNLVLSFQCFFDNFWVGYNMKSIFREVVRPGGHAEWIDMFAVYGVFAGTAIFSFMIHALKYINNKLKEFNTHSNYFVILIILAIYGFLDPFLRIYHIGFGIFLTVPSIYFIPKLKKGGITNKDSVDSEHPNW